MDLNTRAHDDELVARAKGPHGQGYKGGPKSVGSGLNKPRELDDELVARAHGFFGFFGKKGGPKPVGPGPNKPPRDSARERGLAAREFDDELVARAKGPRRQGGKGGPKWAGSGPNKPREFDDELFARDDFEELLTRYDPHLLSPFWKPRPRPSKVKREDMYGLWERMDMDDLE